MVGAGYERAGVVCFPLCVSNRVSFLQSHPSAQPDRPTMPMVFSFRVTQVSQRGPFFKKQVTLYLSNLTTEQTSHDGKFSASASAYRGCCHGQSNHPCPGTLTCHLCTAALELSFGGLPLCQKNQEEVRCSGGTNFLGTPWPEESQ